MRTPWGAPVGTALRRAPAGGGSLPRVAERSRSASGRRHRSHLPGSAGARRRRGQVRRAAPRGRRRRRHRRARRRLALRDGADGALPAVRVTVLEASGAGRRQAAGQRRRRGAGRRGRRVAAAAPPRGGRPGPRGRARATTSRTPPPRARPSGRRGRTAPAAGRHGDGRPERPARARAPAGCSPAASWPGCRWTRGCPDRVLADDVAVGQLRGRAGSGRAVVDRLVEPLLGGVYAGRADELSLEATVPAARGARPAASARCSPPRAPAGRRPTGGRRRRRRGVRRAPRRRRAARPPRWRGCREPTCAPARRSASCAVPRPAGGSTVGSDAQHRSWSTPTRWSSRCRPLPRRGCCDRTPPAAASELAQMRYASMAVVALAFPATAFPAPPTGSGFLVPPVEGRSVKAVTFSSAKWGWYADAGARPGRRPGLGGAPRRGGSPPARRRRAGRPGARRPHRRCSASPTRRSTPGSPGGAAGCRSTPSATWAGWSGSGPPWRRIPGLAVVRRGVRRRRRPGLRGIRASSAAAEVLRQWAP